MKDTQDRPTMDYEEAYNDLFVEKLQQEIIIKALVFYIENGGKRK